MESRNKKVVIAAVVAGALSLAAGTVAAQDYFFPLFNGYVDHPVPGDSPCGFTPVKTITPSTYEDTLMLWYFCEDNRVIARRFFRANGSAHAPQPVYLVAPPASTPVAPGGAPEPAVCPPGFVTATGGGCVPPDHPLAAR